MCVHDVVLGSDFLRRTETFTTGGHRIQRRIALAQPLTRFCSNGSPKQGVMGSINGHLVTASPDTGSDINVISASLAMSLNLDIDSDLEARKTILFIDGSTTNTCGVVRNARWKFGPVPPSEIIALSASRMSSTNNEDVSDWKYRSDAEFESIFLEEFHVLMSLFHPVIQSANLLYSTNAFEACSKHFQESHGISRKRILDSEHICVMKKKPKERSIFSKFKEACKFIDSCIHTGLDTY